MMSKVKIILQQTVIISFFIQIVLVIGKTIDWLAGETIDIPWYIPGSIVLVSFLASLPTLLLYVEIPGGKIASRLRLLFHYLLLFAIVGSGGYVFQWYDTARGFCQMAISFTIIYLLVWRCMRLMQKHDEKIINDALQNMRDED